MECLYDLVIVHPFSETEYAIQSRTNINVGILSLASYIDKKSYRVKILDYEEDKYFLEKINEFVRKHTFKIFAISSTSCFTYRSLKRIVHNIKLPQESILVVGGQQIMGVKEKIFEEIPDLQYACFNEGESTLLHILNHYGGDFLDAPGLAFKTKNGYKYNPPNALSFEELGQFNYKLYPNYLTKIPTIEESRGCPHKCNFCGNYSIDYKVRIKKWQNFIKETLEVYKLYNRDKLFINIGCSTFGMNKENTLNLFKALIPHKNKFLIQAYTRCDTEYEEWIPYLKQLDISSVFFGMESASEEILLRMNKTKDPKTYIKRSQHLIDLFYEHGINLWCNFIFGYVGESADTLVQTLEFILKNKSKMGFLSGHGLTAFPGTQVFKELNILKEKFNISIATEVSHPELLHYKINPSVDFTFEQITALSQILIKIINKKEAFERVYAWKCLGLETNSSLLDEKMDYIKSFFIVKHMSSKR